MWYVIHEHYAPVTLTLEQAVLVGPHDPLIIDFSQSMSPSSFDGKIALSPDIAVNIQWKMLDTQLVLTPKTAWPLATKFSLFIGQGETRYFAKNSLVSFRVTTPVYPTIAEVFPAAGAQDILLGIEDPLQMCIRDRASMKTKKTFDLKKGVDFIGVTCVFYCHDGKGNLLMHKRSSQCRDEHGRWDPGSGSMEHGETFLQTVRREIKEEYCVTPKNVQFWAVNNSLRWNGKMLSLIHI